MSFEQSIPVGGVIPWLGASLGIPLPRNFAVLDSSITGVSVLTGSAFDGNLGLLPNMESKSFYVVEDESNIGDIKGSDSFEIELETKHLPTDYGLGFSTPSYTDVDNTKLKDSDVSAAVGEGNGASDGMYINTNLGREKGGDSVSGTGDQYLRQSSSGSESTNKFPHHHTVEADHIHNLKGTGEVVTISEDMDFGTIGDGEKVTVNTRTSSTNREVSMATCQFIIRLW